MKQVLDNLFGTKPAENLNDEKEMQTEPSVEGVSESENLAIDNSEDDIEENKSDEETEESVLEIEHDELSCQEVNNKPINVTFEVFLAELKCILNSTQGLDFELTELKRRINDLIYKHEAHS